MAGIAGNHLCTFCATPLVLWRLILATFVHVHGLPLGPVVELWVYSMEFDSVAAGMPGHDTGRGIGCIWLH